MGRSFVFRLVSLIALAMAMATCLPNKALAESDEGDHHRHRRPVYQRRAFEWKDHGRHDRRFHHGQHWAPPQVNSGWFQRPYPYHLDYYKMRYGGSYAPYFGNLYGPPQVVTAPPYYGPYYGDYGYGGNGPQAGGYDELPGGAPVAPNGVGPEVGP